jgi:outer membrane lipoprotein SlyB
MKRISTRATVLACAMSFSLSGLSGCAGGLGGGDYARGQAQQEQSVRTGVVESVREVKIEGTRSGIGAIAGGAAGGIGASTAADGKLGAVAGILGALGGGLLGQAMEQGVTGRKGLEITVKLDNGSLVSVTQEADEEFKPGERVRVLRGGGVSRVSH